MIASFLRRSVRFLGLAAFFLVAEMEAATLLSNLPTNNGGSGATTNTEIRAVTFKTGTSNFQVTSVAMQLLNYYSANPDVPLLSFRLSGAGDASSGPGSAPGAQLGSTLTAPLSTEGESAAFSFAPVGTLTLSANTWYWLVMEGTSTSNPFQWVRSGTPESFGQQGQTPTSGVGAIFGNQMINYDSGDAPDWEVGSNGAHSFAIYGNVVPEPSVMVMLAVAGVLFVVLGRRRRLVA